MRKFKRTARNGTKTKEMDSIAWRNESINYSKLMLADDVLRGLKAFTASHMQRNAIPFGRSSLGTKSLHNTLILSNLTFFRFLKTCLLKPKRQMKKCQSSV